MVRVYFLIGYSDRYSVVRSLVHISAKKMDGVAPWGGWLLVAALYIYQQYWHVLHIP